MMPVHKLVGVAASLLVHGLALAAVFSCIRDRPGAVEHESEAVSIEVMASDVVDVALVSAAEDGGLASVAAEQTLAAGDVPRDEVSPSLTSAALTELPNEVAPVAGRLAAEEAVRKAVSREEARPDADVQRAREKVSRTDVGARATPRRDASAQALATTGASLSGGRLSASAGTSLNYAAVVRARVASRKPTGVGRRGTVVISFAVSPSGHLAHAGIARSSGDTSLDSRVLLAVRNAGPFPPPPQGQNVQFAMPFHFR